MKKINLKSILKKTFKKKKVTKKSPTKKTTTKAKRKKKLPKVKVLKSKEKILKNKVQNPVIEKKTKAKATDVNQNLKLTKSQNEQKPEIKKIKKQSTEKREYKIKDFVVYPKHGVGQITEFKKINIGGIDVETYVIKFDKDKANGMVPVNKQSHLRPLATINQVNKCISILKSKPKIKRSMWSRRAQEYEAKIFSGDPIKISEVVRDLFRKSSQAEQSYSERQMFQVAIERLAREVAAVEKTDYFQSTEKIEQILSKK